MVTFQNILMGATLGHLFVVDYDLTTMTAVGFRTSIDYAVSDPLVKAHKEWPITTTHKLVRTIYIPLVMESVVAQLWEHGELQTTEIDASHVRVFPVHKLYGGTSNGFGSDPEFEQSLVTNPGYFVVDGKEYQILDFADDQELLRNLEVDPINSRKSDNVAESGNLLSNEED